MEEENYIVGLEISTSKICAAAASYTNDGQIKIKSFLEKSISPEDEVLRNGQIDTVQKTAEIVDELLEKISENLGINLQDINVNISNTQIETAMHGGSITKGSDSRQIVQNDVDKLADDVRQSFRIKRDRTILHHTPLDFFVNDMKQNEKIVGKMGVQIGGDFYFLTTPSDSIENLYYTISGIRAKLDEPGNATLKIDHLLVSPLADSFSLLDATIDDKRNGVAIVNIGADLTEIAVFHKNSLRFFKAIPIAGNAITNDLCQSFNLNYEEGEKLKKICGILPSDMVPNNEVVVIERNKGLASIEILIKNAVLITEWRLKEIAALVKVELTKAGFENNLVNGIILTGGSSNFNSIKDVFIDVLKVKNIRHAKYNAQVDFEDFENLRKPQYSTLIGLLLAHNNNFDTRVSNKVLRHTPISLMETMAPKEEAKKVEVEKKPKQGIGSIFKKLMGNEDMDDKFENN
jgi:cell division protein FtsA